MDILNAANIDDPFLLEGVSDKGRKIPGLEESKDIMSEISLATNLLMRGGVFVDFLPQLP